MGFRRIIRKRIHRDEDGVTLDGDLSAVISVNVGGGDSSVRSSSRQRIVQRSGPGSSEGEDRGEEVNRDG